jgi:hypothetical protein
MLTIDPGTPVPAKVTVREATLALLAGEVTVKGWVAAGRVMARETV